MADHPLPIPPRFQAYARTRDADIRVIEHPEAECDGEWYPPSWVIVVFREKKISDVFQARYIEMPDDVEERPEALWAVELDLLDMAWKAQLEDYYGIVLPRDESPP